MKSSDTLRLCLYNLPFDFRPCTSSAVLWHPELNHYFIECLGSFSLAFTMDTYTRVALKNDGSRVGCTDGCMYVDSKYKFIFFHPPSTMYPSLYLPIKVSVIGILTHWCLPPVWWFLVIRGSDRFWRSEPSVCAILSSKLFAIVAGHQQCKHSLVS